MNKPLIWVIRHLIIPVLFIFWTTGLFNGIMTLEKESKDYTSGMRGYTKEDFATMQIHPHNALKYKDSVIALRKQTIAQKGIYDPYDYIYDFKQIQLFNLRYGKEMDETIESRKILLNIVSGFTNGMQAQLYTMFDNSRTEQQKRGSGFHGMGPMRLPETMSLEQARKVLLHEKDPEPFHWNPKVFIPFLYWFLQIYLRGLPVAFIMLLIWRLRFKDDIDKEYWYGLQKPDSAINLGPLSFFVSLLLWPIILGLDIRARMTEAFHQTDVLIRRKKMLTVFSKAEEQILKAGKTMSIREFRRYLDSLGLQKQHSFGLGFIMLIIITVTPKLISAKPLHQTDSKIKYTISYTNPDYGGPDIHHPSIAHFIALVTNYEQEVTLQILQKIRLVIDDTPLSAGFYPDIGVIPRLIIAS